MGRCEGRVAGSAWPARFTGNAKIVSVSGIHHPVAVDTKNSSAGGQRGALGLLLVARWGSGGVNLILIVSRNLFKSRPISLVVHCRREPLGAYDLFQ